eukprot:scaffold7246_cov410-Prasinococcus_capsulatus_cf.AAC.13
MDLSAISAALLQSLSPQAEPRKQAESYLTEQSKLPQYSLGVLSLAANEQVELQVRQAAAVNFKNTVKHRWAPVDAEIVQPIQEGEKEEIKQRIVGLMLSTPPQVQAQLAAALAIMSSSDFPEKWQNLLPELTQQLIQALSTSDYHTINGILETTNTIFERYRHEYESSNLFKEMKYVLDTFVGAKEEKDGVATYPVQPLLQVFTVTGQRIGATQEPALLKSMLQCQSLVCKVFYSLNSQELPEVFEDNMQAWMEEFRKYLAYENVALKEADEEKPSVVDEVKAGVCENVSLYMSKNEEEFTPYLQGFVGDIWGLLLKVTLQANQDQLAMSAIRFLTTVSKSVSHALFAQDDALTSICEKVIVPNLRIRAEDEELFEMNPVEYIRRDMEGSDSDTRRRAASELVKGLLEHYQEKVTQLFSGYVGSLLQQYGTNQADWKAKDCAVFLVIALTVKGRTAAQGATATNQLVNIVEFFQAHVLPELATPDKNALPFLKADSLKFLITFRSQIPKAAVVQVLPSIISLLTAESNVVHSYAAQCLERLLVLKEPGTAQLRFTPQDLAPAMSSMLTGLFGALQLPDSTENEYVMKTVMRCIMFMGVSFKEYAQLCLTELVKILQVVCKNPKQPGFNHYLFECIAALLKNAATMEMLTAFEEILFPPFMQILQEDIEQFAPYVFQLLSQLLESRPVPLPEPYLRVFPGLLAPFYWERSGNITALVRLLQAYLRKATTEVTSADNIQKVLGVACEKLIPMKATDHGGFYILNSLVECAPVATFEQYLPNIWGRLLARMQTKPTPKFFNHFVVLFGLFVCKHGPPKLVESFEKVQPGLVWNVLEHVFLANCTNVSGTTERRISSIALTKLLCECPATLQDSMLGLWGKSLNTVMQLNMTEEPSEDVGDDGDVEEVVYSAAYAKLANASLPEMDPYPEVPNSREFLARSLGTLSAQSPGRLPPMIQQMLQPPAQQALQGYLAQFQVSLA